MKIFRILLPVAIAVSIFVNCVHAAVDNTEAAINTFIDSVSPPADQIRLSSTAGQDLFQLGGSRAASVSAIVRRVASAPGEAWTIEALRNGSVVQQDTMTIRSSGAAGSGTARTPAIAVSECRGAANAWATQIAPRHKNAWVLVFNEFGNPCFRDSVGTDRNPSRVSEGDPLYVGIMGPSAQTPLYTLDFSSCDLQPTVPAFEDTLPADLVQFQSGDNVRLHTFPSRECFNGTTTITIKNGSGQSLATEAISQYRRYRGSFHLGVLWTDLDDPSYSTFDFGDGPVIRNDADSGTGPEYVGSLVLYGLPHYFRTLGRNAKPYPGRDIINDTSFSDRLGLVVSIGLSDPKDTLGLGLSFEILPGFNVTGTQLWRRIDVLDGFEVGDAFPDSDIPTKKSWEDDFVIGLSIDGRFLARFFTASTN